MKSFTRFKSWLVVAGLLLASLGARAADIDLFAGSQASEGNAPNVLFVIDTGASFSASNSQFFCNISSSTGAVTTTTTTTGYATLLNQTNGGVEQCALYSLIKSLESSTVTVNVGVMMFNNGMRQFDPLTNTFGSNCTGGTGGCLVMPIVPLNTTTGPRIREWIRLWDTSGSNSDYYIKAPANRGDGATMQEAWAYYFGRTGMSGRDYAGIAPTAGCAQKNIIFLGNNWAQQASPKDPTSPTDSSPLAALKGLSTTVGKRASPTATVTEYTPVQASLKTVCTNFASNTTLDTSEGKGASAINWAMYMHDQGLQDATKGVTTYSVALETNGCDANYGAWLPTLADKGGGEFYSANSYESLLEKLKTVFGNIASVNSVFAAVSLPVSVNTQGTYLNDIYVGMFRPAQHFLPRWNGNIKQYKLGKTSAGVLKMMDADSNLAINTQTGFLTECARSFWTPNIVDSYWANEPAGACLTVANSTPSNYPDGNIVEKGAQGYKLRATSPTARVVKTCSTTFGACTSLLDFSTATATVTAALSTDMINWARGTNLDAELSMGTTTMRASVHGDVVHSRPIPINYGTDNSPSIVVYYGGNDGMFRAVNGNRGSATYTVTGVITSASQTFEAGAEMWSFVPPEFFDKFQRLRDNSIAITSPATSTNTSTQKDYGIDGPITAFQGTISAAAKTYVYATMRRGGRVVYAFDVTIPGAPAILWKKGCPNQDDDGSCSSDYSGIGQTWSSLKSMYAAGYGSGASPLMIMGGGYDKCEDYDALNAGGANHNCTGSTKGNKVYVIDAQTGALVKAFDTTRAVVADSTLVRDPVTGMVKYAYTADMGGNVYRMTFGNGAPATWTITKIASLGCASLTSCTANRKFLFAPSVVTTNNDTYFLMLGSGDREKPITSFAAATAVTNYFFMIKDTISAGTGDPLGYQDVTNCGGGATTMCLNSLVQITSSTPTQAQLDAKPRGWYLQLASTEQVVTSALTIFGVVTFSTHQPAGPIPANQCRPNLGTTNVYNISYLNAASANGTTSRYEHVSGDGLPPSPVGGQVTLDDGTTVPFCIGCSKDSPLEGAPPRTLSSVTQPTNRLYWYIQK